MRLTPVKLENVRTFLLDNVRKDVVHRQWIGRGKPAEDAEDLEFALQMVEELEYIADA